MTRFPLHGAGYITPSRSSKFQKGNQPLQLAANPPPASSASSVETQIFKPLHDLRSCRPYTHPWDSEDHGPGRAYRLPRASPGGPGSRPAHLADGTPRLGYGAPEATLQSRPRHILPSKAPV
jgi:hypothetical protein